MTQRAEETASASASSEAPRWLSVSVIVLAILAAAPAYPAWGVFASTDMPMVFMALALLVLAVGAVLTRRLALPKDRLVLGVLAALLVWGVVSAAFSDFVPFSVFGSWRNRLGLLTLVPFGLLLVLARGFSAELGWALKRAVPWAFVAWLLAVLIQAAPAPFDVSASAWGLSSNGAISAQLMLLLLPALLTLGKRDRMLRAALGVAVAAVMWRIGSTIGIALTLGWTVIDAVLTTGRVKALPKWLLPALPAAHLAVTGIVVAIGASASWAAGALEGRQRFWRLALDMIASSPVFGTGPDTMAHASAALVGPNTAQTLADTAVLSVSSHSLWLDAAACFGIVGAVLAFVALMLLARRWSPKVNSSGFLWIAGLALYAVTLLLQPVVLQTLPLLALVIAASLPAHGGASAGVRDEQDSAADGQSTRPLSAAGWLMPAISGALALVLLAFGLTCVIVGRSDFGPASVQTTEGAARFWRYDPALWAETGYRYGMSVGSTADPAAAIAGVERSLEHAIDLVPGEYTFRFDLAAASDAFGLPKETVIERYDATLEAYALAPDVNYARGLYLAKQGDVAAARETYTLLRATYPDWSGTTEFRIACAQLGITVE